MYFLFVCISPINASCTALAARLAHGPASWHPALEGSTQPSPGQVPATGLRAPLHCSASPPPSVPKRGNTVVPASRRLTGRQPRGFLVQLEPEGALRGPEDSLKGSKSVQEVACWERTTDGC